MKSLLYKETASVPATIFLPLLSDHSCHRRSLQTSLLLTVTPHLRSPGLKLKSPAPGLQLHSRCVSRALLPLAAALAQVAHSFQLFAASGCRLQFCYKLQPLPLALKGIAFSWDGPAVYTHPLAFMDLLAWSESSLFSSPFPHFAPVDWYIRKHIFFFFSLSMGNKSLSSLT